MFSLSAVYLIYNLVKFIGLEPGDKAKIEARNGVMYGIAGMVIMFSVYGLIGFVLDSFGIRRSDIPADATRYIIK
ncbi:MAG: hypothetical protein WAX37_02190 [Minisyncoccia bacterium]